MKANYIKVKEKTGEKAINIEKIATQKSLKNFRIRSMN